MVLLTPAIVAGGFSVEVSSYLVRDLWYTYATAECASPEHVSAISFPRMHCVQAPSKLLFWGFQNRPTLLIWRGYLEPCFYYLYTVFNAVTTLRESVKTINCCFGFYNVGYASKIPYAPAVNILKLMFTVFVLLGPYVCCAWHSESRLRGIRVKATVRVLALQIQKKILIISVDAFFLLNTLEDTSQTTEGRSQGRRHYLYQFCMFLGTRSPVLQLARWYGMKKA